MKISDLFKTKKVVYSFEIFPPRPTSPIEVVYDALAKMQDLNPDFVSVTYGAGGSGPNSRTCEIVSHIKENYDFEPLAHLTCINSVKKDIEDTLKRLHANQIENILALRGDRNKDGSVANDFHYASELIEYVKQNPHFSVAAACYPEGHPESENLSKDIEYMKLKEDYGAEFFITQLFFDNEDFYRFVEKVRAAGISSPIHVGIMPVTNTKQIERILSLSGSKVPHKLSRLLARYGSDKDAMMQAGILYATEQIVDLLDNNVQGIHLYTMNSPSIARHITQNIDRLLYSENTSR
ncbi:MAG: methylenetetrahydrofolate reductase [NAD(P)H] [Eubacteriaceae bacterium]|jgi:methylenetetrahydrofolate reductase (NADPH)|nr:methylenetetrahydrofolate reductase [NAD(P)H] [Eubacteriaceae bacterium]